MKLPRIRYVSTVQAAFPRRTSRQPSSSQRVARARAKFERKEIPAAQLKEVEDNAIRHAVKRQEDCGLQCVTDGEMRRRTWHMDSWGALVALA